MGDCNCNSKSKSNTTKTKTNTDTKWLNKGDNIKHYIEKLNSPFKQTDIIKAIVESRDNFVNTESTVNKSYLEKKDNISFTEFKLKLDSLL